MPILHKYRDGKAYYVRTKVKGVIITFQLTAEGVEQLRSAGVRLGEKFSRWLLLDLYSSGQAFTGKSSTTEEEFAAKMPQGELDFSHDTEPETLFPACSACASLDDLHLVEIRVDEPHASILCARCRQERLGYIDASIPLPLVTKGILNRFLQIENIQKIDPSVDSYKSLLNTEFSRRWEALVRKKPVQESLLDESEEPQGALL